MNYELKKCYLCRRNLEILCLMKKYLFSLLVMVILTAGFSSCKPDQEIYNPKCKISKIWHRSEVGNPSELFVYDNKGKELQQIIVDSLYSFDFSYNKDKTVSKIVHDGVNYTETVDFQWTDCLVDKMSYQVDGNVVLEYTFHRIDDKKDKAFGRIDYIEVMYDGAFYEPYFDDITNRNLKHPLYDRIFGDYKEIAEVVANSGSKGLTMYSVKKLTYAPGDNKKYESIDSLVEEFPVFQKVVVHKYYYTDKKDSVVYSPFYGLPFAYADVMGYSLKMPEYVNVKTYVANSLSKDEHITYEYVVINDKHYPRHFKTRSSENNNIPINTYIWYK